MNRVVINLVALRHNLAQINSMIRLQGSSWSVVTKALCGHEETIQALAMLGVRSIADSRLDNIRAADRALGAASANIEKWYLRLPHLSVVPDVVQLADVSLNSEIRVIKALSDQAVAQDKTHRIIIMIEVGDLREGILPGSISDFYRAVFNLPRITVLGIGAQVGCLAGAVPNEDQLAQLGLYRELLELKFERRLPLISAGSSIFLPKLFRGGRYPLINHYRVGESLFLGTDLVSGERIEGLRDDVIVLEAEIAEIKEKSLVPQGEVVGSSPFEQRAMAEDEGHRPGQRGYRALVAVGNLDTDVAGLTPLVESYRVAGASSDVTVVNLSDNPNNLEVGDTISFKANYAAFLGLMNDPYIAKQVTPSTEQFREELPASWSLEVAPTPLE